MNTDPLADMLTQIRNARLRHYEKVSLPASRLKQEVARVLKQEGYIKDYKTATVDKTKNILTIYLKYGSDGSCVINKVVRVSKPGRRVYCKTDGFKKILDGLGTVIISTPKGVMSNKESHKLNLGGEVLCYLY